MPFRFPLATCLSSEWRLRKHHHHYYFLDTLLAPFSNLRPDEEAWQNSLDLVNGLWFNDLERVSVLILPSCGCSSEE